MGDTPQFFKPLIPGFLSNFRIPKPFLKHLGLGESNTGNDFVAVLKDKLSSYGGDGEQKTWRVEVDSDGRRFLDGWQEFADDHSLSVGEFLVFDYLGGFVFEVLVFDPISACARSLSAHSLPAEITGDVELGVEKYTLSLSARKTGDVELRGETSTHSLSAEKTGDIELSGENTAHPLSPGETVDVEFRGEKTDHSLSLEKTGDVEVSGENTAHSLSAGETVDAKFRGETSTHSLSAEKTGDVELNGENIAHCFSAGGTVDVELRGENTAHSLPAGGTLDAELRGENADHFLSAGETVDVEIRWESAAHSLSSGETVEVEVIGEKSAHTDERAGFKPSRHPYFRASVKQYCFKWHAMLIPTQFARLHNLAKRWCEMTLIDQEDRAWPMNLRHRKTGKDQVYLASGWDEFSVANGLKVGDSVVFELIDSGSEPVMKFYKVRCDPRCSTEGESNKDVVEPWMS